MIPKKYYMGNYPNSSDYDSSLPIGWNKYDAQEVEQDNEEDEENENDEPIGEIYY